MPPKSQQATISSFFKPSVVTAKKRPSSPIDLTAEDDRDAATSSSKEPPLKKSRLSNGKRIEISNTPAPRKHRVYAAGDNAPPITVTKPKRPVGVVEARKRWALSSKIATSDSSAASTMDVEGGSQEGDEESSKRARRRAFAAKLDVRESQREQRQSGLERSGAASLTGSCEEDAMDDVPLSGDDETLAGTSKPKKGSILNRTKTIKSTKGKGKNKQEIGPSGQTYTPLEKQVLALKQAHPNVLLLVEVGYKYRFFGEDAQIASRELGIACYPNRNFLSASIPVHRRTVHVKKLISQGYKVGVIGQAETAALKKVSDNRSAPFDRVLTHLYTAATYVDDLESADDAGYSTPSAAHALVCIIEQLQGGMGADERVTIGLVSVVPSTGDIIYDEFQDSHMRTELETRMTHIKPSELLIPSKGLSKATSKMLAHFTSATGTDRTRIEEFEKKLDYSEALDYLTEFYTAHSKNGVTGVPETFDSGKLMAAVVDLPKSAVTALAHAIQYLSAFNLSEVFLQTSLFSKFTSRVHMLLNGNTLSNLEIYRNQTDFSEKGSLLWILDRTKTRFGARLLKTWIGRPLTDKIVLQERVDAVDEILNTSSQTLDRLKTVIKRLPDLVRGLCLVQYGKCTTKELATLLEAYQTIATTFEPFESPESVPGLKSPLLRSIVSALPSIKDPISGLLATINLRRARNEEMDELWLDEDKFPAIEETKMAIMAVEADLEEELKSIRKTLKRPNAKWVAVNNEEYLIEVPNGATKEVPASWIRVSSTKAVTRWHTPDVKKRLTERELLKETLLSECQRAFKSFLIEVSNFYGVLRDVTNKLAVFDCLNSLATVATESGYVKPIFVDEDVLDISGGRHPMVEALRSDPFVPNNISLGLNEIRHKIITGPNMGGKSSFVRMTALIAIMAQIGSYVPAQKARLGLHDAVLTRMGASDELARGRSTFMVEISETSDILKMASPRTLVVLDELGRGTSTFDGMSIAFAVLQHLVEEIKCKTLFITHYPLLATEMGKLPQISNGHMGFIEEKRDDGTRIINFLYRISPGMAGGSFGVECAQLAGMPDSILRVARERASFMQNLVESRKASHTSKKALSLLKGCLSTSSITSGLEGGPKSIEALRELAHRTKSL